MYIEFNKIYIIESLPDGDQKTGTQLYEDLLKYKQDEFSEFSAELCTPEDKSQFQFLLEHIKDECGAGGVYPILHFEIHGSANKDGLVLKSGELFSWEQLRESLIIINTLSKMNLFISLAVCHGAHLLKMYKCTDRAFCAGVLGSFEEIYVNDLQLRFNEFYKELFTTFDINRAYDALYDADNTGRDKYECISCIAIFVNSYRRYVLNEINNNEELRKRSDDIAKQIYPDIHDIAQFDDFFIQYNAIIKDRMQSDYQKHMSNFFMLDLYPENKDKFNLPESLEEFMKQKVIS